MIAVGRDMFLQQDHGPLLPILHASMREDRYPRLAEIAVPTVVMVGSADQHHTAEPRPTARRRGSRRAAGHRARRRAHIELGGARRAGRCHRIVPEGPRRLAPEDESTRRMAPNGGKADTQGA